MPPKEYKLRFWGVRGTVPTASPDQLRYGGNTSCLAADLGNGEHLVLDCGTGLRLLGDTLEKEPGPHRFHIFISHYHLDHVIGLPFFKPLYDSGSTITFHGFSSEGRSVDEIIDRLMSPPYFPITLKDVPATVEYKTLDGNPVQVGEITVNSFGLNHPDGCLSFRLEHGDRRIVYATDHEHGDEEKDQGLIRFSQGADALIYDATFQEAEYESLRRGWGHSTWYAAVQAAMAAKVKKLVLFHHHPEHTDEELDKVLALAQEEFPGTEIASETLELSF